MDGGQCIQYSLEGHVIYFWFESYFTRYGIILCTVKLNGIFLYPQLLLLLYFCLFFIRVDVLGSGCAALCNSMYFMFIRYGIAVASMDLTASSFCILPLTRRVLLPATSITFFALQGRRVFRLVSDERSYNHPNESCDSYIVRISQHIS